MPRRPRYASKSKGGSREWPAAGGAAPGCSSRRLPLIASSSPISSDRGNGDQRAALASRCAPRSRPAATSTSADEPNAPGRGAVRRWARRDRCSPSRMRWAKRSSAARRACPTRQPASTSAPAKAARRGARSKLSEAAISAAATSTSAAGDSARTSPPPRHAIETCHGRRRKSAATGRAANPLGGSGEAPLDVRGAVAVTAAARSEASRTASRRCPRPRAARPRNGSRRGPCGIRGFVAPALGRCRRAGRAARSWPPRG